MNRWTVLSVVLTLCLITALGCSGGQLNPVTPASDLSANAVVNPVQTHLWGYYDVYIDIPTQTVTAVPNRSVMFAANVVQYVSPITNLHFTIIATPVSAGYVDVDIDVHIKHPFPGMTQYNGYDVRGIFIGNATTPLKYNSDLKYAVHKSTTDQEMYDYHLTPNDPGVDGNPDGYTRWFNPSEFGTTGLFGYTKGGVATVGYNGTATLNPYKYFADGLGSAESAYDFLTTTGGHGVFSAGATNTRNYYLRFPAPPGVKFNYSIVASWKGEDPDDHPANAPEACAISANVTPEIYYTSGTDKGGKLKVDFKLPLQWGEAPSTVYLESSVLTNPYQLSPSEMVPTGGTSAYSTYHAEVTADNITGNSETTNSEYWIIAQYDASDYKNTFGVTNTADDMLAAFFRYDLFVASAPYNKVPTAAFNVVTPMPVAGWVPIPVTFHSTSTDPDPGETATLIHHWDFDGDSVYDEATDDAYTGTATDPIHTYAANYTGVVHLTVTDINGATSPPATSPALSVTIKTSCSSMTAITGNSQTFIGSARIYPFPPEGTRAASPARLFGSPNGSAAYIAAIDPDSTSMPWQAVNNPGYSFYNLAVASNDRIYYNDSGSANIIYYMDFSNSAGFTNIRTASSFGAIPAGTIHKLVLDKNDNPIVLTQQWKIYHWNGSTWGSGITVPSAVQTAAGSYSYLNDFDYDPTTGFYLFVENNGLPGVYAVKADGTVAWQDADIWAGAASGYDAGVEVMQDHAECAIVLGAGVGGSGQSSVPFYFARINPMGGQKTTSSITNCVPYGYTFAMFDGNGGLMKVGSAYRWYSATYGGNVWGYATMPAGF
jgi:hypothetical protein